jgi:predicted amidophosphoribosyltransferase
VCDACRATLDPAPPAPAPPDLDLWRAPFAYVGVARELVARVKYRDCRAAVPWLADAMVVALGEHDCDLVTWAPTTRARRRSRGFDHAELLGRAVAERLDRRCLELLVRTPGPAQTGRRLADRRAGPSFRPVRSIGGARVVLVDDVATTGATLAAGARALRLGGARAVAGLTAARTPSRRGVASVHSG